MTCRGYLTLDERFGAAIAALGAGPVRTRRFLDGFEPSTAWEALADGRHPADPDRSYQTKARPVLVDSVEAACAATGVTVRILGRPGYPASLASDAEAPAVLFTLGEPSLLDTRPRVAIVGTRSATPYGLGVACELGRGLADAGVAVVSGLARGIDSAAHAGALAAAGGGPPVAVIGTAPDAAVHRADVQLQQGIVEKGAVLSERAPGSTAAPPWCFVVRNRVMAALAHVVVVVECHREGGSMHTVRAASDRGVAVVAVPGSVRSSASAGCNALLVDGAAPVRDVQDVLSAVELAITGRSGIVPPRVAQPASTHRTSAVDAPNPVAARTLRALDHDPASLDTVVRRSGLPLADVAEALEQLAAAGLVTGAGGWWSRQNRT
ncbi:MAG TPA: DNA-processing protein DprA [Acidimicrobiales bacterium]|nr:DNA-processing protein DprA [Acidimicrobiales bacterium]